MTRKMGMVCGLLILQPNLCYPLCVGAETGLGFSGCLKENQRGPDSDWYLEWPWSRSLDTVVRATYCREQALLINATSWTGYKYGAR